MSIRRSFSSGQGQLSQEIVVKEFENAKKEIEFEHSYNTMEEDEEKKSITSLQYEPFGEDEEEEPSEQGLSASPNSSGELKSLVAVPNHVGRGSTSSVSKIFIYGRMLAIKKLNGGKQRIAENEVIYLHKVKSEYVVPIFDYNLTTEPYILLELADCSLQEVLKASRPSEADMKRYASQILKAVSFIHGKNVCHNDLKADNILFAKGQLKLADFGIASDIDKNGRSLLQFNLCCNISSPEKLEAFKRISGRVSRQGPASYLAREADTWALGVLFYKMANDRNPYMLDTELEIIWCPEFHRRCSSVSRPFYSMITSIFNNPIAKMEDLSTCEWLTR